MERHWTPESNPKRPRDGGPETLVSKTNLVSTDMPNGNTAKNFQSSPCTGWIWKITAKSLGYISSVQLLSRVQLFMTPMDCSTPGFPVHRQLPEFTQTHVHWVSDAIQPSHPLSFPSPPALNLSQHQGLFQWVSSSYQVAKVLEFQLQYQSFQWIVRTDFL